MKIACVFPGFAWALALSVALPVSAHSGDDNRPDLTPQTLTLKRDQLDWIGQRIFQNECASKPACLVHWNQGEAFPSLGIGHFIWYPEDVDGRFVESFPELIHFMRQRSITLPDWIASLQPVAAPWSDRSKFESQIDSPRVQSLRRFLEQTKAVQAEFIVLRAQQSLSHVADAAPDAERKAIRQRIAALSGTPGGTYALIDYVNFKGEGLKASESYAGQGWGLLQVLQQMAQSDGNTTLERFRNAAATVLTRRAENAPKAIERERWLAGWLARLNTYREAP